MEGRARSHTASKWQQEASLPHTQSAELAAQAPNPGAWHSALALGSSQRVVGSGRRGQELGKGSVFIKNRKQGRLELVLKHKIMESFLEIEHMLLNSDSDGFAPGSGSCGTGKRAGPRSRASSAPPACLASGSSAPRLWAEGWRVPDLLRALLSWRLLRSADPVLPGAAPCRRPAPRPALRTPLPTQLT